MAMLTLIEIIFEVPIIIIWTALESSGVLLSLIIPELFVLAVLGLVVFALDRALFYFWSLSFIPLAIQRKGTQLSWLAVSIAIVSLFDIVFLDVLLVVFFCIALIAVSVDIFVVVVFRSNRRLLRSDRVFRILSKVVVIVLMFGSLYFWFLQIDQVMEDRNFSISGIAAAGLIQVVALYIAGLSVIVAPDSVGRPSFPSKWWRLITAIILPYYALAIPVAILGELIGP
jgi:hypothetical protein